MRRRAWVLAAPAIAVALATAPACGAPPSGGSAPAVSPAAGADGVLRVRLDHRPGGDGASPVVEVPRGTTVELVVGSATAERVVVSGLDQVRYVTAGGTVTMRFLAAVPGTMTVGLGGSGTVLGRLDVR